MTQLKTSRGLYRLMIAAPPKADQNGQILTLALERAGGSRPRSGKAKSVLLLYLQGGVGALIATSSLVEKEIRSLPDFSNGLVVGLAVSAVLMIGLQKRST